VSDALVHLVLDLDRSLVAFDQTRSLGLVGLATPRLGLPRRRVTVGALDCAEQTDAVDRSRSAADARLRTRP
jgi:hypothetical protein